MERYTLNLQFSQFAEWEYIGQARGDVHVPAGRNIMLQTSRAALADLSPLAALGPDDLYQLEISAHAANVGDPDVTIMPHLQGLTGLRILGLLCVDVSTEGLRFLEPLTSLTHLLVAPSSTFEPMDSWSPSKDFGNAGPN
jgi:hypothetical protein